MDPMPFDEFAKKVLSRYTPAQRSPATRRMMVQALRELGDVPSESGPAVPLVRTVADLTEESIAAFVDAQPRERSVARTVALLRCLRAAVRFACRRKWLDVYPFEDRGVTGWMRSDSKPRRKKLVMTAEEIGRVKEVIDGRAAAGGWRDGRLKALFYIYIYTGFRGKEGTHILRRNFDRALRTITLEAFEGWRPKTVKTARAVPLHPDLFEALDAWEPRCGSIYLTPGHRLLSPWKGGPGYTPLDGIRDAALEAGIANITIIAIRRTLATLSPHWGIDPEFRRQLLGHTDVETSETWYVQREVELLRGAVERIHYGPPAPPAEPPGRRRAAR